MKNDTRLPTQMDWLCTVEFIPEDDEEARLFATEIIGHVFGFAQATNTRALALVSDADANVNESLFSTGMILTFEDELLTNTVSMLCPRCIATTPRRHLLGKGGPQGPGYD